MTNIYQTNPSPIVKPIYRGTQIIWYVFYIIEVIILLRFLLKLIGANPAAVFTDLVYRLSYPLVAPFLYVIRATSLEAPSVGQGVVEWSTLLALFVYWIIAWAIVRLLIMAKPVSRIEADQRLNDQITEE
jgi:hypothetical protein